MYTYEYSPFTLHLLIYMVLGGLNIHAERIGGRICCERLVLSFLSVWSFM